MNSKEIVNNLKKTVFGQDEYLKTLAVFAFKHKLKQEMIKKGLKPNSNNLLVVGETGCGKTFAVKQLSNLLEIPFVEVDCSNITQTGYKGGRMNVDEILDNAYEKLGGKIENAIVFLDEFDKIFDESLFFEGKGLAQMQNYLKLLEGEQNIIRGGRTTIDINTKGISFIAAGTFENIKKRININNKSTMGFASTSNKKQTRDISQDDIIKGGFMPELIGRFSSIINLNSLSIDDFTNIIIYGQDSPVTNYKEMFKFINIDLKIDKTAAKNLAILAKKLNIGARGISNMLNDILNECLYDASYDDSIYEIHLKCNNEIITHEYKYRINEKQYN